MDSGPHIVFTGATLIDTAGGKPVKNSVIVVKDNIIRMAGPRNGIVIPENSRIINLDGKYVLPGFIDMHVHTARQNGIFFPLYLYFGITTVRDTGGSLDKLNFLRKYENENPAGAPRIFFSGPAQEKFNSTTEIEAAIRKLHRNGADFIKIYRQNSPEHTAAIVDAAGKYNLSVTADLGPRAEINWTTAEQAAIAGVKGLEHASGFFPAILKDDIRQDMLRRFDDIFSSRDNWETTEAPENFKPEMIQIMRNGVDPEKYGRLLDFLVDQGVYLVPTLDIFYRQAYYDDADMNGPLFSLLPEDIRNTWTNADKHAWQKSDVIYESTRFFLEFNQKLARDYVGKGGKVLAGTDSSLYYQVSGYDTHKEIELLVEGGLTPVQGIKAATIDAAETLGMESSLGTIEPGKLADFIVVNRNPLADITATRDLHMIIKNGQIVDRGALIPLQPLF